MKRPYPVARSHRRRERLSPASAPCLGPQRHLPAPLHRPAERGGPGIEGAAARLVVGTVPIKDEQNTQLLLLQLICKIKFEQCSSCFICHGLLIKQRSSDVVCFCFVAYHFISFIFIALYQHKSQLYHLTPSFIT